MTRSTTTAAAVAVLALLGGAAATAASTGALDDLVDQVRPAAAVGDADLLTQTIDVPDGTWQYGAKFFFEAGRPSSGNPVVVHSDTPDVCVPIGTGDSGVQLVAVGGCALTLTQDGDGTYAATTVHLTRTVAPRTLFVSVGDYSRPTGTSNPAFPVEYAGFVAGDSVANLTTAPTVLAPPPSAPVGTYALVPSGGVAANYHFDYTPGTLTVTATLPNPEY